jgi:hypothetical protein
MTHCLIVGGIGPEFHRVYPVGVDALDDKVGLTGQESLLRFLDAVLDDGYRLFFALTRTTGSIHDGQTKVGRHALAPVRDLLQGAEVIEPVQSLRRLGRVVATEQCIDLKRSLAQGCGEFVTTIIGLGGGGEFRPVVAQLVQLQILLNVLGKVDQVAIGSGNGHRRVGCQFGNLIQVALIDEHAVLGIDLVGRENDCPTTVRVSVGGVVSMNARSA